MLDLDQGAKSQKLVANNQDEFRLHLRQLVLQQLQTSDFVHLFMPCWGERATEKKQLFCPAKVVLLDDNCEKMIFCWQRLRITNAEYHD